MLRSDRVQFRCRFTGVPTKPVTATSHEEAAVNSDNARQEEVQEEPAADQKTSPVKDDSFPTPDHQSDTTSNPVDATASEATINEIQQVCKPSESTIDKNVEDDRNKVVAESVTDGDTEGGYSKAVSYTHLTLPTKRIV